MKKIVLIFPLIFVIFFQTLSLSVCAQNKIITSKNYCIQFEKLMGTEDAKEFNSYKKELLVYFNKLINKKQLPYLKETDLDFNNESVVQGIKVYGDYTDYSLGVTYDDLMKKLSDKEFIWIVTVKTKTTAVCANISHCTQKNAKHFHFAKDWCIHYCDVSKSYGEIGSSETTALSAYTFYGSADANIKKVIKADDAINKNDDIKVVYTHIGNHDTLYHDYMNGGIVFVNGRAKYIYASGFVLFGSYVVEETPEDIKNLLRICSDNMFNNKEQYVKGCQYMKGLYDYDFTMTLIRIYETYALY